MFSKGSIKEDAFDFIYHKFIDTDVTYNGQENFKQI